MAPGSVSGKGWLAQSKLTKRQNIEEKARLRSLRAIDLGWLAQPKLAKRAKAGGR
jgi:hypothetical protein